MSKKSNFRLGRTDKAHYSSLEELREAFGLKPIRKRTTDKEKLSQQREKFLGTCKCCKKPMSLVSNSNVLVCSNPECKGFRHTDQNEDETTREWFTPYMRMLDERGAEIGANLFD